MILRVLVFTALMIFSWALWFAYLPGVHGQTAVWLLFITIALLFGLLVERVGDDFTRTLIAEPMSLFTNTRPPAKPPG